MKKYIIYATGAIIFSAVIAAIIFFGAKGHIEFETGTIEARKQKFKVEIADNADARKKGLSGREYLCAECGMVFLLDASEKYSFWMKNMRFPLDIIWINGEEVVFLAKNVPANSKKIFYPEKEANLVLEINAGLADKYGIREGDKIKLNINK